MTNLLAFKKMNEGRNKKFRGGKKLRGQVDSVRGVT